MKRRIFKLCVFLLLGAIVNVAVAWGCALSIRPPKPFFLRPSGFADGGVLEVEGSHTWWYVQRICKPGVCWVVSEWYDHDGGGAGGSGTIVLMVLEGYFPDNRPDPLIPWWATNLWPPVSPASSQHSHQRLAFGCGWPMIGLWMRASSDSPMEQKTIPIRYWHAILIDPLDLNQPSRALPLRPLWPGFAINTMFYGAILWLLFAAPGSVRRRIRARRGQCPACAYPVGSSDVCTECGKPVKA